MKLIIGGAYQGKKDFALSKLLANVSVGSCSENCITILDGQKAMPDQISGAVLLDRFHLFVKRGIENGWDLYKITEEIKVKNPEIVIICDELGCGIVPMDPTDRKWREETGRLCCILADQSEEVYRVFAGIAQRIK